MIKNLRDFPSVEKLLNDRKLAPLLRLIPKQVAATEVKSAVAEAKKLFRRKEEPISRMRLVEIIRDKLVRHKSRSIRRVINGTGTIVHTNLGRAPLAVPLMNETLEAAGGYCNLEFDVERGKRGRRGEVCEEYLARLSGAESATIVNNCAAALFIIVNTFANRKSVVISRGELVQIGGGFRIPEILKRAGGKLHEVGTSNVTSLGDYEQTLENRPAMILKVHKSNFAQKGFTSEVSVDELVELCGSKETLVVNDLGSGSFVSTRKLLGYEEPTVWKSVKSGADLTCFSGDKLVGGMQAGLIVGKSDLVAKVKKNPIYRALRADKFIFASFERVFESYLDGNQTEVIPLWRLLSTPESELYRRGKSLLKELGSPSELSVVGSSSFVGGGAAPDVSRPSVAIRFSGELSGNRLARLFRQCNVPVIGRIEDDCFLIDLRAIEQDDIPLLRESISRVLSELTG